MAGDTHHYEECGCGRGEARREIRNEDGEYEYVCDSCFREQENRLRRKPKREARERGE